MKKFRLVLAGCILLMFITLSCSSKPDLAQQRQQGEASRNLGEAYLRQGNYTAALREMLRAETLIPDDYFLQNDLGLAYYYKSEPDRAIVHFKKALSLKNDYAPARNNLGNAYMMKNDWDDAIEQYTIVVTDLLYATPQFPYSNLGFAYYQKKEYELSEKSFKQALEITPDFANALYGISKTYLATGRVAEAVEKLEYAVEKDPSQARLLFELAEAYVLKRDYRRAYGAYIQVVQINPDSPLADEALRKSKRLKPLL